MRSLGAPHLLMLLVLVLLALDSRRLHTLARSSTGRGRRDPGRDQGIPAGANPDQVGLPLRQIQMRHHVDWQDGGAGWEGPEILPGDGTDALSDSIECDGSGGGPAAAALDGPAGDRDQAPEAAQHPALEAAARPALPVLWQPFPALPAAGASGDWPPDEAPALAASGSAGR